LGKLFFFKEKGWRERAEYQPLCIFINNFIENFKYNILLTTNTNEILRILKALFGGLK